ncbi:hypothetical protein SAMN04515695_3301 [Pseudovibrio sp. Tun.PSC04-5.I4]|nr:hypothetical protein SAMN04515695_3301 [Pseudovibrio sp. Tun.PSC04-5.I4]
MPLILGVGGDKSGADLVLNLIHGRGCQLPSTVK